MMLPKPLFVRSMNLINHTFFLIESEHLINHVHICTGNPKIHPSKSAELHTYSPCPHCVTVTLAPSTTQGHLLSIEANSFSCHLSLETSAKSLGSSYSCSSVRSLICPLASLSLGMGQLSLKILVVERKHTVLKWSLRVTISGDLQPSLLKELPPV